MYAYEEKYLNTSPPKIIVCDTESLPLARQKNAVGLKGLVLCRGVWPVQHRQEQKVPPPASPPTLSENQQCKFKY